jgi:hypothetical protein
VTETTGDLVCPRCGAGDGTARFYGPCEACRSELRVKFAGAGDGPASTREAYEPKSNVTPNFVATKE